MQGQLLSQLDASAIEQVLGTWIQATLIAPADEPVALDSKTLRGARSGEQTASHLLAFCTHHSQETLWQVRVDAKSNEIPVAQAILPTVPIRHRRCKPDALHTQTEFMRIIHEQQAETVLTVKGNQPTLYADLATYFADPVARYQQAETIDRQRGRTEIRSLKASSSMNAYLASAWPYIAQVAQLTRRFTKVGKTTTEVVYLIATLSPSQASPRRLLELVRGHWKIENRLHWRCDVTLGKDAYQTRTSSLPSLLARINSVVLSLMDRIGVRNVPRQMRSFDAEYHQALDWVLAGRCSVY